MYVQLYRSKIQFYRKFGGKGRHGRPRCCIPWLTCPGSDCLDGIPDSTDWQPRARLYRRLLAELPGM